MTPEDFSAALNVSRETMARLMSYEKLLRQWQGRINLVSRDSLSDLWRRHFLDSGQLCRFVDASKSVTDIGSGAGFPGLVLAIINDAPVTLIESDQRKAAFLREAVRITQANVTVIFERAETAQPAPTDVVTARAVAPLTELLELAYPWLGPAGECLFLKGAKLGDELTDANRIWDIDCEQIPSLSDPGGVILRVKEYRRV